MIAHRKSYFRIVGRLILQAGLCVGIFYVCSVNGDSVFALPDTPPAPPSNAQVKQQPEVGEREQRTHRIPPRVAIEACEGKREGDPCTFNAAEGVRGGECLSGVENVFACRPYRGTAAPDNVRGAAAEQQIKPPLTPEPNSKAIQKNGSESNKQVEPLPSQHSTNPITPQKNEPTFPRIPPPIATRSEDRPLPPPSAGLLDNTGQYASGFGSYLVVAIIAAALTWYGLFRYSTVPLRRLRKVTQQLAGGDLSARVGEGLFHRKDEVADLGRDVDRMAERIESLVGAHQRLIRDVSHELRSPLARLNVALELARQSAGPTHSAPFDRIERESDRLNELIGQLLMLTKLENESGTIQRSELDIAALIVEIAQDVDFEARNNDRRVVTTAFEALMLNGNRELLRQALENLVRNAIRYTAKGTEVEISLRKKESGGRCWAHIEVRDQGPGVPESELYDIFRPFYRVNDARERQSGGTGVGLAISDRAVRLHGGTLRAFNAPGAGLVMEMELPMDPVCQ